MDLNLVVLAGRLAAPAEERSFESGHRYVRFLVTTKVEGPQPRVDVVPVTLWDPPPELTDGAPPPGSRLWVAGSVQRRFWAPAGRRSRLEVVAHHIQPGDGPT